MTKKKNDCDGQKNCTKKDKNRRLETSFNFKIYDMIVYYTCSVKDEKKKINHFVR